MQVIINICFFRCLQHSYTGIHVASQGKPEIVRMLIDANCNINVLDDVRHLVEYINCWGSFEHIVVCWKRFE